MKISDSPVADEIMEMINDCIDEGLQALGQNYAKASPVEVVAGVDDFVGRWRKGFRPPAELIDDEDEARFSLGSVWGAQLVNQFGWEWTNVDFGDDGSAVGVVSPDRSLAIYPFDFMGECFDDPECDPTILLSFNMLLEGNIPKMKKKSYTNVMDGVHRVIPRE